MMQTIKEKWIELSKIDDVQADIPLYVVHEDLHIALYRCDDGNIYATDNICTHAHALLSEGFQEGYTIECPLHAGCFDIRTGKGLCAPVTEDLKTYPVRIEGDAVLVDVGA